MKLLRAMHTTLDILPLRIYEVYTVCDSIRSMGHRLGHHHHHFLTQSRFNPKMIPC